MHGRLLITFAWLLSSLSAFCQNESADTSALWRLSIDESMVSSYYSPSRAMVTDQIPKEGLARLNSVADALRTFSGVQMKDYGGVGGMKTINVRSLGSEHTGVFVDGLQVDNAQNMQVDLGRFQVDNLAYVDLYSGARSSGLQTAREYASASSVYLTSLRPALSGESPTGAKVRVKAGSFGTLSPGFDVEHLLKKGPSLRISSDFTSYDGKYRFHERKYLQMPDGSIAGYDTVMVRQNADLKSLRLEAQLFSSSTSSSLWDVKAYLYDSQRGLPGPVLRRLSQTAADRQWDTDVFVQGSYRKDFGKGALLLSGKASYDFLHYKTFPEIDPYSMAYDNRYGQYSVYGSGSYKVVPLDNLSFNLAADFQYMYLDSNMDGFVYPSRYSFWWALQSSWTSGRFRVDGSLVYALALDRFGDGSSENAGAYAREKAARDNLSPSLSFIWRMTDALTLSGFFKRTFRMPSFNDLYYTLIGNVSLDPESAWQSDAAILYERTLPLGLGMSFRQEVYCNHVTDKIIATPTTSQFRWSMYNIGNVHILGSDTKVTLERAFFWEMVVKLMGKYSFQDARDFTSSKSMIWKNQIPYVAKHSGSVTADILWREYSLAWTFTATGKRYSTGANIDDYLIDPWRTHDVYISRAFELKKRRTLQLKACFNNIFNQQYEFVQCYPMPGFNFQGTVMLGF